SWHSSKSSALSSSSLSFSSVVRSYGLLLLDFLSFLLASTCFNVCGPEILPDRGDVNPGSYIRQFLRRRRFAFCSSFGSPSAPFFASRIRRRSLSIRSALFIITPNFDRPAISNLL